MSARRERPVGWWCQECKGTGACEPCLGTGTRGHLLKRLCRACNGERDCTLVWRHRQEPGDPAMTRHGQTPGVVARWTHRTATEATRCDECGEALDPGTTQCPQCRQAPAAAGTGMLAVVVETTAGDRRLVVAERTSTGGWAPTRHLPATDQAVRALARQDVTRDGAA